jgi:hypothetical protein
MEHKPFFSCLEDIVLFFSKDRTLYGDPLWQVHFPSMGETCQIAFSDRDVAFLQSVATAISSAEINNTPDAAVLTDRQCEATRRIIGKVRGQLSAFHKVELPDNLNDIPLRYRIRHMDRRRIIELNHETSRMEVRFPYNPRIVDRFKKAEKESCGYFRWGKASKCWEVDLTEGNIYLLNQAFIEEDDIQICPELVPIFAEVVRLNENLHEVPFPTMEIEDGKLVLKNCAQSVEDFLLANGWPNGNLVMWAAYAPALALNLGTNYVQYLRDQLGEPLTSYMLGRSFTIKTNPRVLLREWLSELQKLHAAAQEELTIVFALTANHDTPLLAEARLAGFIKLPNVCWWTKTSLIENGQERNDSFDEVMARILSKPFILVSDGEHYAPEAKKVCAKALKAFKLQSY